MVSHELAAILEGSPADVAVLVRTPSKLGRDDGICVPFGGGEHDWAALELGAWLSSATGTPLRLVGTRAEESTPRSARRQPPARRRADRGVDRPSYRRA